MSRSIVNPIMPFGSLSIKSETRGIFYKILFRSSAYAISAYFIVLAAERLLILGGALLKGFSVVLKYDTIKVIAPVSSWDQETVLLIYLIPFLILIISFIWLNIRFMRMEFLTKFSKLFILWMLFFIIYRLAGMFPSHLIFKTGIDYILNWLYFGFVIKVFACLISLVVFFIAGYKILRGVLAISGNYHSQIRILGMLKLMLSSIVIPVIAVIAFAVLFHLPGLVNEELAGLGLVLILLFYFFVKMSPVNPKQFDLNEDIKEKTDPKWLFVIVVVAVIMLRILVGMEIKIS